MSEASGTRGGGSKVHKARDPGPAWVSFGDFIYVDTIFDLFGNPWIDCPKKRGRPAHEVTVRTRNRVSMLLALGWSNPRIASALGVTLPTFHKYYFYELRQREVARDRLELRRLEMAWELAEGGNVGALKEFGKLMERNDRMEAERTMGEKAAAEKPSTERVGKKVIDAQLARDADSELAAELELEAAQHHAIN